MSLMGLTEQMVLLLSMAEDGMINDETFDDAFDDIDIDGKYASYAVVIKQLENEASLYKVESDRLKAKHTAINKNIVYLKSKIIESMAQLEIKKGGNKFHTITYVEGRKNSVLTIDGFDVMPPEEYVTREPVIDKAGIKAALKDGVELDGFSLTDGSPYILIK